MGKFMKTYYPIINTWLCGIYIGFFVGVSIFDSSFSGYDNNPASLAFLFLLMLTVAVLTLTLKIAYIVDAVKRFKGSDLAGWIALLLFAEANYILCHYNFRFKQNRKDYKTLIAVYIISIVASVIFGALLYKMGM